MEAEEGAGVEVRDVVLFREMARCPVCVWGEGDLVVAGVGEGEVRKEEEGGGEGRREEHGYDGIWA